VDVIQDVGPDGHYLYHDHTMRYFKTEYWYPALCDRHNFEEWVADGRKPMRDRVVDRTREILATHEPAPLRPETAEAISAIMEAAEDRVRNKT